MERKKIKMTIGVIVSFAKIAIQQTTKNGCRLIYGKLKFAKNPPPSMDE